MLVRIALAAAPENGTARPLEEDRARSVGLSGAEIDAARAGHSFDIQEAAAIRLARAIRHGDRDAIQPLLEAASRLGLSNAQLAEITALALHD